MLLLSEIRATSLTRSWRREDGTYGNVYQVEIKSGDDVLLTETFLTQEGMEKRGIVPGAVGQARVLFDTNTFTNRDGRRMKIQRIRLVEFEPMVNGRSAEPSQQADSQHHATCPIPASGAGEPVGANGQQQAPF